MKKQFSIAVVAALLFLLQGCGPIGDKAASLTLVYLITALASFLLWVGYFFAPTKKEPCFIMLFTSVLVVNLGYFLLSLSKTAEAALFFNSLSYLGAVFLPLSMLFIILKECNLKMNKWMAVFFVSVTVLVFLLAASPVVGSKLYYAEVSWIELNGAGSLEKSYGTLHSLYLIYLLFYFGCMIYSIIYACVKKTIKSSVYAIMLLVAVFLNIGIWLLEQLVKIDFELLAVSYIITELFLLALSIMILESEKKVVQVVTQAPKVIEENSLEDEAFEEKCRYFESQLGSLTNAERHIYELYIGGKKTKEILEMLNITENTLKYHNKNIYSKLGVSSRKELIAISNAIKTIKTNG